MSNNIFAEQNNSLEGKILVASPHIDDPYFNRALIYICAHDISGAIGVMINQKIGTVSCNAIIGEKTLPKDKKIPLMFGGPVNSDMLVALSLNSQDSHEVTENDLIVHTDVMTFFKGFVKKPNNQTKFILAKGVAAWDAQQLEEEISENAWFVIEPCMDLIFSQKLKNKWSGIIKNIGIVETHGLVHYSGNG